MGEVAFLEYKSHQRDVPGRPMRAAIGKNSSKGRIG